MDVRPEMQIPPSMTPQQEYLTSSQGRGVNGYKRLMVGSSGWPFFTYFELVTLALANLGGVLGYGGRSLLYPSLFRSCGARPAIGRGIVLRNPKSISLGEKILIDDYAALDARGTDARIEIGDYVSIGRFTTISAKESHIKVSRAANIGSYCRVATQSKIEIGESVLIAAYCYIGPGNHRFDEPGKPLISQPMDIKGGVKVGDHAWIGAHSTVLDGVEIGEGAIIGAHSLVKDAVPARSIVAGIPARKVGEVALHS